MWVTVAVVVVLIALIWRYTGRPKGLPPGPTCYPFIGNVGLFKPSDAVQANRKLRKQYGDIYTVMFFHKPMITVHGYDNIRELLVKNVDMFLERPITIINGVFNKGKGLMWSSGPVWEEHRAFALTTMKKLGFGKHSLQGQIMEEVDCLMDEVEKFENKPFDIHHALNTAVSNVICSLLFGKRFDHEDAKFKNLIKLLNKMFASTNPSSPAFVFPLLRFLPGSGFHNMEKSFRDIDAFTKEIIEEHRRHFDGNNINDYVDGFLFEQTQKKNSTFTDEQLIISVREFFGAGTETTATTLRWAVLFLIHHPEWQRKLRDDIDALLGQSHPKMEHKEQLPRVEAFILEVQRHANIAPFAIPRAPKKDFSYNGYNFPKGICVCFALDSVLMDPDIFPEPTKFKPDRFLDKDRKCNGEPKEKLIPFSTGLVWSSGPLWKEQRTFALTTMRKFGFGKRSLQGQIMEEVDCLMEELEKYENKSFDIQNILNTSVSNVICSLLFGKRFEYEDTKFKRLIDLLNKLFATGSGSSPEFVFPILRHLPMSRFAKVQKLFDDIDGFTSEIIEEHRRNFDANNINDFIDGFLLQQNETEENSTFTDEQLKISVREFFAAGTETTSTTLRWSLLFLIHHPEWQQKLRNDIDAVIGQSLPTMERKKQLPLVEAFILEVQRHANLFPLGLPHAPKEDFNYKGYHLPKGTFMFFVLDSVLTDPEIFPEPTKFKPERFLDNGGTCNGEKKEKLIPFSTEQDEDYALEILSPKWNSFYS